MVKEPNLHLHPDERTLRHVAQDNIRINQIGGLNGKFRDGISEDAARDLGFHGFDSTEVGEIRENASKDTALKEGWFDEETKTAGKVGSAALRSALISINPDHPSSKIARSERAYRDRKFD